MEESEIRERVDNWNDKNSDTNYKIIEKDSYRFLKVMTVLFFILSLISFLFIVYIWYINDFKGIFETKVNNTNNINQNIPINITSKNEFSPYVPIEVDNNYQNYNNYTIYNNITIINGNCS